MNQNIPFDEKAIIERARQAMSSDEPTIPQASVKKFLAKIGEEIQRSGELRKEVVDGLLQQLHDGAI